MQTELAMRCMQLGMRSTKALRLGLSGALQRSTRANNIKSACS